MNKVKVHSVIHVKYTLYQEHMRGSFPVDKVTNCMEQSPS